MTDLSPNVEAKSLRFIKDTPAEQDDFGTHDRIARAVAAVIRTHDDLKVIGLVGPWGSGKSTVISLIERDLNADQAKTTRFFIYDAWLHQSDPPRRSFLETLVAFLDLTRDQKWQERLDELNGQIDDSNTTTTPSLTAAGKWILLSLLLLPLGFEFVGHDWFSVWIPTWWQGFSISVFACGMLFLIAPIVIASLVYLKWRPTWTPFLYGKWFIRRNLPFWDIKRNWLKHRHPHDRESILTLFMSKAVTRVNHRITRSPDPTTIEFQKIFRDIINAVSKPEVRYIFVVDNLDRLPEAAAVELWATIRSFFLGARQAGASESNKKLPTILLPIDPDAVTRMYAANDREQAPRLAQAFMDKTFDLTFRVPPPVFSDWKKYLAKQMNAVFGDECTSTWVYAVGELYEKFFSMAGNGDVTPRLINALINSVAVLWLQWKGEIPFATLAYFAINKSEIEQRFGQFIRDAHPEIAKFDADWAAGIAAIHFGVPVADAIQVHLEGPLKKSIALADVIAFVGHSKTPGFDRVFEAVIGNAGAEPEFISHAAFLLGRLNPPSSDWVSSSWHTLIDKLALMISWKTLTSDCVSGVHYALLKCSIGDLRTNAQMLCNKLPVVEPHFFDAENGTRVWADLVSRVVDVLSSRECEVPQLRFPGSPKSYLELLLARPERKDILEHIEVSTESEILSEFGSQLSNAFEPELLEPKFNMLFELQPKRDWILLLETAQNVIRNSPGNSPQALAALTVLGRLRTQTGTESINRITALSNEGFLFEKLAQAHAANAFDQEASVLAHLVLINPSFQNPGNQARAQVGLAYANTLGTDQSSLPSVAGQFEQRLDEYTDGNFQKILVDAAEGNEALAPLAKAALTDRVERRNMGSIYSADILSRLPIYLKYLELAQHNAFAVELMRYPKFPEVLRTTPMDDNVRRVYRLLLSSVDKGSVVRARDELAARVKATDVETWEASVRTGTEPFAIAGELRAILPQVDFGDNLFNALSATLGDVRASTDQEIGKRWFKMCGLLSENAHATLMRALRDVLVQDVGSPVRLSLLSAELLDAGHFDEEPDRSLRYLVLPHLSLPDSEAWLTANSDRISQWLGKAPETTRGIVRERIVTTWTDGDDDAKRRMVTLGGVLKFQSMPWDIHAELELSHKESVEDKTAESDKGD